MNIQEAKKIASKNGFQVFYDRSLKLWTFIHESRPTQYLTKLVLEKIEQETFINIFIKEQ